MHVWDVETFEPVQCGGGWFIDCGGFNSLLSTETAIWGAANNGSVYMWDAESRCMNRELTHHSDAVRCIEGMGTSHVVSGSGSQDGSLVVWRVK
jgi:WD40 repeat protein